LYACLKSGIYYSIEFTLFHLLNNNNENVFNYFMYGITASSIATIICYPLDFIRTNLANSISIKNILKLKKMNMYKGLSIGLFGHISYSTCRFVIYNSLKQNNNNNKYN